MASTAGKNTIYFLIFAVTIYIFAGLSACQRESDTVPTAQRAMNRMPVIIAHPKNGPETK